MVRFLPLVRAVRITRFPYFPSNPFFQARYLCSAVPAQKRPDTLDLGIDDIPETKRASSIVDPQTDPKPKKYSPLHDNDRDFAMAYWKLDEEKLRDGELDEPQDMDLASDPILFPPSDSSPSPPTTTSTATSSSSSSSEQKKPYMDSTKSYRDRLQEEMNASRERSHAQMASFAEERHAMKEQRIEEKKKRQEKRKVGGQQEEEEREEEEEESEEESEEDAETKNLYDTMEGKAELTPDWYAPLPTASRPNTELCTSIDQFSGFFRTFCITLHELFSTGWDPKNSTEIEKARERVTDVYEYLTTFDDGLGAIGVAVHNEDEAHKNYFLACLDGKAEGSAALRQVLDRCLAEMHLPHFGYVEQVKMLRQLQEKFLPLAGINESAEESLEPDEDEEEKGQWQMTPTVNR